MNKYLLIIVSLWALQASAQTQQGYVKTKGRLGSNGIVISGTRLPGTTVMVRGSNAVLSGSNGTFALSIPGNSFYLQSVQKQGYVLTDPDILSKQYACSKNPLVLVLESPSQQADDKLAAEKKIRRTLQLQLQDKEDEIELLKEQQKLTEEECRKRLQEIYAQQNSNEKLIGEMADRYSRMDFDEIDEFNRKISQLILDGKLAEADSLLNTKGDINRRVDIYHQHQEANAQEEEEIKKRNKKLEKSKALAHRELEELAQDCYSKFEIFKMQHQNDSASYYIELRANLDTASVDWQNDAGCYLTEFIADYDKAESFLTKALQVAIRQRGEQSIETATCIHNLGLLCSKQSKYSQALECYEKTLQISLNLLDSIHPDISLAYSHIGVALLNLSDYNRALEFCLKALDTARKAGNTPHEIAIIYNNLASIYSGLDDSQKAIEYYQKALDLYQGRDENEDNPDAASAYNNIGLEFFNLGEYNLAWENYCKALTIETNLFGTKHPSLISTYINISHCFSRKYDMTTAIQYLEKALNISLDIFGENNLTTATCYGHLGQVYDFMKNNEKALEYMLKATKIRESVYTGDHDELATSYNNLGSLYDISGNDSLALEYYQKALDMRKKIYGENHSLVASIYNNIGMFHANRKRYAEALENLHKALSINETILAPGHPTLKLYQTSIIATEYYRALDNHKEKEFLQDKVFTATVVAEDTPAGNQGMSGKYILLEFADWTQDSPKSLFEKNSELAGHPKDIVVMKDGVITRHHFENTIGVQFGLECVGAVEKENINKLYLKWKQQ